MGKMKEFIDVIDERRLNVLGLSETKWKGQGSKEMREDGM